jgi:hypothetical protein
LEITKHALFFRKIKELTVEVEVIAMQVINPFDYFVEEYAEEFPFTYDEMLQQELTAYLKLSEESPIFKIHGWFKTKQVHTY